MHYAGWELYQKTHDLYEAFTLASDKCDSGMYHGVCEKGFSKRDLPIAMIGHCYHGLGHAFMFITDNDLNQSLVYCDHVSKGHEESCYAGVFMENTISKQVGKSASHVSKTNYDLNDPDYPCNRLEQKYKNLCYIYKGSSNILFTNIDVKRSVLECTKVLPLYQEKCFWGIGMNIPGPHLSSRAAGEKCNEAFEINPQAYKQCILGAMAFLTQLNLGNASEIVEFCDAIKKDYKPICYSAAGSNLIGWTTQKESLKDKCEHFSDPEAVRICLNPNEFN